MQASNEMSLTTLPPAQRAAVVLKSDAAEKDLRAMIERTAAITTVVDTNGRKEAHAAAMAIKGARVDIEKAGKTAREDATAFSKAVIAEAARLAAIAEPEEDRLLALRDNFDAKMAAEKAEKERIEAERKAGIRAKIDQISRLAVQHAGATSAALHDVLTELAKREITEEEFAEFTIEAQAALDTTAHALLTLRVAAKQREEEEAERKRQAEEQRKQAEADRLELAKLRAQQAEDARIRAEEVARIEKERAAERAAIAHAQALVDQEAAKQRAEEAAARAALEKKIAEMEAERAAEEDAKRQKAEADAKLVLDHEKALQMNASWVAPVLAPVEPEPEDEAEEIATAPVRPSDADIARTVASFYCVPALDAARWLCEIDHAALIGDLS
jgi:hypothetical protein